MFMWEPFKVRLDNACGDWPSLLKMPLSHKNTCLFHQICLVIRCPLDPLPVVPSQMHSSRAFSCDVTALSTDFTTARFMALPFTMRIYLNLSVSALFLIL